MQVPNFQYKEEPLSTSRGDSWIRGLNALVSATQIQNNELAEATDIQLVEDGKIQLPRDGQVYFGTSNGSRVQGLFPFYKSDGTRKLLRMVGTTLQVYNSATQNFDNVSGFAYTTSLNTSAVTAYDKLYLSNGTDPLTYYDGTSIQSFTALSTPSAPTVTQTGGTGSFTFSYKITATTVVGETPPSTAGTATSSVSTLTTSNYMSLSWSAVTNATGYNVYGRKDGKWSYMAYLEGNGSTSYVDKGTDTPNAAVPIPTGDSTAGPKGKYSAMYNSTLFVAGDPSNPSRLYYSGGGDQINNFSVGSGGGLVDIAKNDGQTITGMRVFKNTLLIFKTDSIYQFSFATSGLPQVTLINPAVGCIAPLSIIAVENDVFFASRRGIFTVGNEAGFAFDVLRTNEVSAKVRPVFQSIDPGYLQNVAGVYATVANKNLVIFSYTPSGSTTNSRALVYDRERLAWYKWTNIQANCWTNFIGTDGVQHVLYGDDASGYVKEVLKGSDDFGTAINGIFRIKAESFKMLERYKTLKNVSLVLRQPKGAITVNVIQDGITTAKTVNIATTSPSINFGHYVFTKFQFKTGYGTGLSEQDNNLVRRFRNVNILGRSFMLEFTNSGSGASFTLLETYMEARAKSQHYYASGEVVS